MAHPVKGSPIEVLAFRISSPCGRVYELPLQKVQDDYIDYLVKEDKMTREQATQGMTRPNIYSWFMEQFNWSDVENYATLVEEASPQKIKEALDHFRNSSDVATVSELMVSPRLAANLSAKQMAQSTPPATNKSTSKSPRRRI